MATASKSFTAVGAGTELSVKRGETLTYSLSGTYSATVKLQRHVRGNLWEDVGIANASDDETVSGTLKADVGAFGETRYRFFCSVYTSGTVVTSLADVNDVIQSFFDLKGVERFRFKDGTILESVGDHFSINSFVSGADGGGKTLRLNSVTNIGTANDLIGFQSKPGQGASTAKNVMGAEISPRLNSGVALTGSGSIIGLHVDTYLKGTAAGAIAGDVRAHQVELVTDDAGVRAISGYVTGMRIRAAFSATVTGKFTPFRVEKAETQTGSKNWDALFHLTGASPDAWNKDPGTELNNPGGTVKGYIKVVVDDADRYIALYEKGNLAD